MKLIAKSLYVNSLPADVLSTDVPLPRIRQLFARYVDLVEIENHSYCNRVCWFCPNVFLDRRSANHLMPDIVFDKIVGDLASIGYSGTLVWSRYHEPTADESIYRRLAAAREALPNALLALTSNGDYLNRNTIAALEKAGLDRLLLDLYLPDHREHDPAELASALDKFVKRTGLNVTERSPREYLIHGSRIDITMGAPLYTEATISTRGGLLDIPKKKEHRRTAICLAPLRHVVIDYNGKGMLCCQTRSDAPSQAEAVIGDLSLPDYSIFDFYRDLGRARRALVSPGAKRGVCESCDVSDDGPDRLARRPLVSALMRASGLGAAVQRASRRTGRRYQRQAD